MVITYYLLFGIIIASSITGIIFVATILAAIVVPSSSTHTPGLKPSTACHLPSVSIGAGGGAFPDEGRMAARSQREESLKSLRPFANLELGTFYLMDCGFRL